MIITLNVILNKTLSAYWDGEKFVNNSLYAKTFSTAVEAVFELENVITESGDFIIETIQRKKFN